MFLLIQSGSVDAESGAVYFTFQYVSINTGYIPNQQSVYISLHSNMFLLILIRHVSHLLSIAFTFQYVSINTPCAARSLCS